MDFMDWTRAIGAVTRLVEEMERDGKPARRVVAERTYDTTVVDLWDAITSADRIPRWFMPIEGDLRLGGRYRLIGNASGTITHCDPPRHLGLTWEFGGETSWVDVTLADVDGRARLRLDHVAHVPEDLWAKFGPGAVGVGWDLGLFGLGKHVEGAPAVDPKEAMAWLVSDEGKRFVLAASDDWCRAEIASGSPPDLAKAAAARTAAAYGGGQDPG